jgi:hypothetical protein
VEPAVLGAPKRVSVTNANRFVLFDWTYGEKFDGEVVLKFTNSVEPTVVLGEGSKGEEGTNFDGGDQKAVYIDNSDHFLEKFFSVVFDFEELLDESTDVDGIQLVLLRLLPGLDVGLQLSDFVKKPGVVFLQKEQPEDRDATKHVGLG